MQMPELKYSLYAPASAFVISSLYLALSGSNSLIATLIFRPFDTASIAASSMRRHSPTMRLLASRH